MGHGKRSRPKKLGEKLKWIRMQFGITQSELAERLKRLGADSTIHSGYITDFEKNEGREPSLLTILAYSKLANISANILIDDKENLNTDSYTKGKDYIKERIIT